MNIELLRSSWRLGPLALLAIMLLPLQACKSDPSVCTGYKVEPHASTDRFTVSTELEIADAQKFPLMASMMAGDIEGMSQVLLENGITRTNMTMDQALAMLDHRPGWKSHPWWNLPRHPAEKYLDGWVFVLDPGHGGKSLETPGWKMGPTGVREAEMNLRVGLMLRAMLEDAGATVGMTRTEEVSDIADDRIGDYDHGADADPNDPANWNTLKRRAHFANTFPRPDDAKLPATHFDADGNPVGADLFISLHHNASSSPKSNYTTVWFHGPAEHATVELDAARHLARDIGRALRTDVGLTCPVMNDRQMYGTGFAVLRHARVPAVLTESSFFSNPEEEQRLADPGYLIREAYAIYWGLCELAYSGRPTQRVPDARFVNQKLIVETALDDGMPEWWGHDQGRTLASTFFAEVDGKDAGINVKPDPERPGQVRLECVVDLGHRWSALQANGEFALEFRLTHANFLKAHNWPQRYAVDLKWEPGAEAPEVVAVRPLGAYREGQPD